MGHVGRRAARAQRRTRHRLRFVRDLQLRCLPATVPLDALVAGTLGWVWTVVLAATLVALPADIVYLTVRVRRIPDTARSREPCMTDCGPSCTIWAWSSFRSPRPSTHRGTRSARARSSFTSFHAQSRAPWSG